MKYTPSKFQIMRTVRAGGQTTYTVQKLVVYDGGTTTKLVPVDVCTVDSLAVARERKAYHEKQEIVLTEIVE